MARSSWRAIWATDCTRMTPLDDRLSRHSRCRTVKLVEDSFAHLASWKNELQRMMASASVVPQVTGGNEDVTVTRPRAGVRGRCVQGRTESACIGRAVRTTERRGNR